MDRLLKAAGRSMAALLAESRVEERAEGLRKTAAEFSRLRNELLRSRRAVSVLTGSEAETLQAETAIREMVLQLFVELTH